MSTEEFPSWLAPGPDRVGLRVDVRTVRVRSEGPATGVISIVLDGASFPADGWSDFVVVVFAAWTNAIARLLRGSTDSERVRFMEGPYQRHLVRIDEGTICVNGIERFSARELAENAIVFGHWLLQACQERGAQRAYSPGDVVALEQSLGRLSSVASVRKW